MQTKIQQLIVKLDIMISNQLAKIIHSPNFQALEASWISLHHLVFSIKHGSNVVIKLLTITRQELKHDLLTTIEFDQSQLFHKLYSQEIGMPGGVPYNVIIADFYFSHQREDLDILHSLAQIAAAAFSPVITSASAKFFGLSSFSELTKISSLTSIFQGQEYQPWENLRVQEDSRYIGITLPKRLVRLPYHYPSEIPMQFVYSEPELKRAYLWGNAAYAFAEVLVRSFQGNGWLADIRGCKSDQSPDGHVAPIVVAEYATDKKGLFSKPQTECLITDTLERQLKHFGFMGLTQSHYHNFAVFYHTASIQKSKLYHRQSATLNAETASYLQYLLCACRFAHYIKILGRDKIGSGVGVLECQHWLNEWLLKYVAANSDLTALQRSRYPLQDAKVKVTEMPGKPGSCRCVIHLKPHFQLEQLQSNVVLVTEIIQ